MREIEPRHDVVLFPAAWGIVSPRIFDKRSDGDNGEERNAQVIGPCIGGK